MNHIIHYNHYNYVRFEKVGQNVKMFFTKKQILYSLDIDFGMGPVPQPQLEVPAGGASVLATGLSLVLPPQWIPAVGIISSIALMRQVTKAF